MSTPTTLPAHAPAPLFGAIVTSDASQPLAVEAAEVPEAPASDAASDLGNRLNWLRAGVLGANDGIVSLSGLVIGVAAAGASASAILTAGLAGIAAGALSMAAGEYVSVSTQRDSEKAHAARTAAPDQAADAEFTSPWHAAGASMLAFLAGSLVPVLAMVLSPHGHTAVIVTVLAAALALAVTGCVSARLGRSPMRPAVVRNVVGGLAAMAVTYVIGALVGTRV